MKITANEIKPGMIIEHKNDYWNVLKTQHVKPGKGGAFNQVELKSLLKQRGHDTKGRKNALVKRLIEFDVSMIPKETPFDRITYGEEYSELVEALLNDRRDEEEE